MLKKYPDIPVITALLTLACIILHFVSAPLLDQLSYEPRSIFYGEIWRLWTAHWIHFSSGQVFADVLVFFLLGVLVELEIGSAKLMLFLLTGSLTLSLGLLLWVPDLHLYRGASGLDVMLAVFYVFILWHKNKIANSVLIIAVLLLYIKIVLDAAGFSISNLPENIVVVWQAHFLGALAGLTAGFMWTKFSNRHKCRVEKIACG